MTFLKTKRSNMSVLITVLLMFSPNAFAGGGSAVTNMLKSTARALTPVESSPDTLTTEFKKHYSKALNNTMRLIGPGDELTEFNKIFNKAMELLERNSHSASIIQKIREEGLPTNVINRLREALKDPLKLLQFDDSGRPLYFVNDDYSYLYRSFFQLKIDLDNESHVAALIRHIYKMQSHHPTNIDDAVGIFSAPGSFQDRMIDNYFAAIYTVSIKQATLAEHPLPFEYFLDDLCTYPVRTNIDVFESSYFRPSSTPFMDRELSKGGRLFGKIKRNVQIFPAEVILKFWDIGSFRQDIFNFIEKSHLTNPELVLRFAKEAKRRGSRRLSDFIKSSLTNNNSHDPFMNAVLTAAKESQNFADELNEI